MRAILYLIRSKSTAYGRVTRRASSGPACILRVVIPGLGVMRAIQELPPRSDRESARRATGMASDCLTTTPPTGATSRRRPPRGAFLIPRPLAEEPHCRKRRPPVNLQRDRLGSCHEWLWRSRRRRHGRARHDPPSRPRGLAGGADRDRIEPTHSGRWAERMFIEE